MHDRWLVGLSIRCNKIGDALKHLFSTCYIRDARARVEAIEGVSGDKDGNKTKKSIKSSTKKKSKSKSKPAFMTKKEPEKEPLEEPLNLCGLLVDQREDLEVSTLSNNKVMFILCVYIAGIL